MNDKKRNTKKLAMVALIVLLAVSTYVAAHPTETVETEDFWEEMERIHERIHGEDYEEHYRWMHGEDREDGYGPCHGPTR